MIVIVMMAVAVMLMTYGDCGSDDDDSHAYYISVSINNIFIAFFSCLIVCCSYISKYIFLVFLSKSWFDLSFPISTSFSRTSERYSSVSHRPGHPLPYFQSEFHLAVLSASFLQPVT